MFFPDDLASTDTELTTPEETKTEELAISNPSSFLANDWWASATPEERTRVAPNAFLNWEAALKKEDKGYKVPVRILDSEGEEQTKDVQVFNENGSYTADGLNYINQVKGYFSSAAKMEDGGVFRNEYTGKIEPSAQADAYLVTDPNRQELFPELDKWMEDKKALDVNDQGPDYSFKEYTDFINDRSKDGSKIDTSNPKVKEAFDKVVALQTFDPTTMKDEEVLTKVAGEYVINPKRFAEASTVTDAIKALPDVDPAEKRMMLANYETRMQGIEPVASREGVGDFIRGAQVSLAQIPELFYGTMGLIGDTVGSDGLRDWGLHGYEESAKKHEPLSRENDDVSKAWEKTKNGDYGALLDWAQYGIGYALGQMVETVAIAVGGAAVGAAAGAAVPVAGETGASEVVGAAGGAISGIVAKQGVKTMTRKLITSLVEKQALKMATESLKKQAIKNGLKFTAEEMATAAAKEAAKDSVKAAAIRSIGSTTAIMANAGQMELGSIYPEAVKKAREEGRELTGSDLARVWGWGIAAAASEGLSDKLGLDLVSGKYAGKIAKMAEGRIAGAAIGGLGDAMVEGSTELVQTFMERMGARQSIDDSEAKSDYLNSALQGALGGAAIGGGGAAVTGIKQDVLTPIKAGAKLATFVAKNAMELSPEAKEWMNVVGQDTINVAQYFMTPGISLAEASARLNEAAQARGKAAAIGVKGSGATIGLDEEAKTPTSAPAGPVERSVPLSFTSPGTAAQALTDLHGDKGFDEGLELIPDKGKNANKVVIGAAGETINVLPVTIGTQPNAAAIITTSTGSRYATAQEASQILATAHPKLAASFSESAQNEPENIKQWATAAKPSAATTSPAVSTTPQENGASSPAAGSKPVTPPSTETAAPNATSARSTSITPEAHDIVEKAENGDSAPAFISASLEKIAKDNGIKVTDSMRPMDVVNALKEKRDLAPTTGAETKTQTTQSNVSQEKASNQSKTNANVQGEIQGQGNVLSPDKVTEGQPSVALPSSKDSSVKAAKVKMWDEVSAKEEHPAISLKQIAERPVTTENAAEHVAAVELLEEKSVEKPYKDALDSFRQAKESKGNQEITPVVEEEKAPEVSKPEEQKPKEAELVVEPTEEPKIDEPTPEAQVEATVEYVLNDDEKKQAAAQVGERTWNATAKQKFRERLADWMVTGKEVSSKLIALFKKVLKAMKAAGLVIGSVVTLNQNTVNDVKRHQMTQAEINALNPEITAQINEKKSETVATIPFSEDNDGPLSQKVNDLASADDTQLGSTPETPQTPKFSIDLNGHEVSSQTQLIAEWQINNRKDGKSFVILDKDSGKITFFDATGKVVGITPALWGRNNGDFRNGTSESWFRTASGDYNGELYDSMDYGLAIRFDRIDSTNFLIHATAEHSKTVPFSERNAALETTTSSDNNKSSGCININKSFAREVIPQFTEGGHVMVLPQTEEGWKAFEAETGYKRESKQSVVKLDAGKTDSKVNPSFIDDTNPSYVVAAARLVAGNSHLDEEGGNWQTVEENLVEYTPGKGRTLAFGQGTVVAIGGDQENVLVLQSIVGNKFVFRKINTKHALDAALGKTTIQSLRQLSDNWNAHRLHSLAQQIAPHLEEILGQGEVSEKTFRSMLEGVMKIVAPEYDASSIVYEKLEGDSYFRTETTSTPDYDKNVKNGISLIGSAETDQTPFFKEEVVIKVDKEKMLTQLRSVLGNYKSGVDGSYNMFTAAEVGRQISNWAYEEQIHRVALDEFTQEGDYEKLLRFVDEITNFDGDKHAKAILQDLLDKTIAERIGPVEASALKDEQKIMIAHEMMRKMYQLVTTGTFSEMQNRDSQILQEALNADVTANKRFKGLATVMALLRRYMRKIKHMLMTRQLMGHLTPNQLGLMQRLDAASSTANLKGDVDRIGEKVHNSDIWNYQTYAQEAKRAISKVAFEENNTKALNQLKDALDRHSKFGNISLEDVIEVNAKEGTLSIRPEARKFIEAEFPNKVDFDAVDKALNAMNAVELDPKNLINGKSDTYLRENRNGETSTQIIQTQLLLANRRLESARYLVRNILPMMDGSELDQLTTTDLQETEIEADKRRNLILENSIKIRKFLSNGITRDAAEILLSRQNNLAREVREGIDKTYAAMSYDILAYLKEANQFSTAGQNKLMDFAESIGFPIDPTKFASRQESPYFKSVTSPESFDGDYLNNWRNSLLGYAQSKVAENSAFLVEALHPTEHQRVDRLERSKMESIQANIEAIKAAQKVSADTKRSNSIRAAFESVGKNITDAKIATLVEKLGANPLEDAVDYKDAAEIISKEVSGLSVGQVAKSLEKGTATELDQDVANLVEYYKSMKVSNELMENFVKRALGDAGVEAREVGMDFVDGSIDTSTIDSVLKVQEAFVAQGHPKSGATFAKEPVDSLPELPPMQVTGFPAFNVEQSYSVQSYKNGKDDMGKDIWVHVVNGGHIITNEINGRVNPNYTRYHSNMDFIGKTFYRQFSWSLGQGRHLLTDDVNRISQTGGFNIGYQGLGMTGQKVTAQQAFEPVDSNLLYSWNEKSFKDVSKRTFASVLGESKYDIKDGELVLRPEPLQIEKEVFSINANSTARTRDLYEKIFTEANKRGSLIPQDLSGNNTPTQEMSGNAEFDAAFPAYQVVFNEQDHSYKIDGRILPSVTTIKGDHPSFAFDEDAKALEMAGGDIHKAEEIKSKWKKDREIGTAVHNNINKAFEDPTFDPGPQLSKIITYIKSIASGPIISEKAVWMDGFAGTIDLLVPKSDGTYVIIDFKTMDSDPFKSNSKYDSDYSNRSLSKAEGHRLQMAAYKAALESRGLKVSASFIIPVNRTSGNVYSRIAKAQASQSGENISSRKDGYDSSLMATLDNFSDWVDKIETAIAKIDETFGDKPTLAAHLAPLLQAKVDEAKRYLAEYRAHLNNQVALLDKLSGKEFEEALGALIKVDHQNSKEPIRHQFENMKRSIELLNKTVGGARTSLTAYTNPRWRNNIRRETSRTSRDAGYGGPKDLSFLKEYAGDTVTDSMLEFYYEYGVGPQRKYRQTATFALDLLKKYEKTEWSNDGMEKFINQNMEWKDVPVFELDRFGKIAFEQALHEKTKEPLFEKFIDNDGNEGERPVMVPIHAKDENVKVFRKEYLPSNFGGAELFAYSLTNVDADGRPLKPFSQGEQGSDPEDVAKAWIAKRMDDPDRMRRALFSEAAMTIGMSIADPSLRTFESAQYAVNLARWYREDLSRITAYGRKDEQMTEEDRSRLFDSVLNRSIDGLFSLSQFESETRERFKQEFLSNTQWNNRLSRIDPTDFLRDLIEFKAKKESEFIDTMRAADEDINHVSESLLETDVALSLAKENEGFYKGHYFPSEEVDLIQKQLAKDTKALQSPKLDEQGNAIRGGSGLFYASQLKNKDAAQISFVSSDEVLSLLLQNAPKDLLIYVPTKPVMGSNNQPIGLRYYSEAGIIYAPQLSESDTSRTDAHIAFMQVMRQHLQNEQSKKALTELASDIRNTFAPFMEVASINFDNRAETLLALAESKSIELTGSVQKNIVNLFQQHLVNMQGSLENLELVFRKVKFLLKDTKEAGMPNAYLDLKQTGKRSINSSNFDSAAIGYEGDDYTTEDDLILIGELFSNPKLKQLYDETRVGLVDIKNTTLPDNAITALIGGVLSMRRNGQEESALYENTVSSLDNEDQSFDEQGIATDQEGNQIAQSEDPAGLDENHEPDNGGLDEMDEDTSETMASMTSKQDIEKALGKMDLTVFEAKNVTKSNTFDALNFVLAKLESKDSNLGRLDGKIFKVLKSREDDLAKDRILPSDAQVLNFLNILLEQTQALPQRIAKQGKSNREILQDSRITQSHPESRPMLPEINPDGLYNGDWSSLTSSRNGSNNTQYTINFRMGRIGQFKAGMYSLSLGIRDQIARAAEFEVKNALRNYDATGKKSIYYRKQDVAINITDAIVNQMRRNLPEGLLDRHLEAANERLFGKANADGKLEGGLINRYEQAKAQQEEAFTAIAKAEKEISDMDLDAMFGSFKDIGEEAKASIIAAAKARLLSELKAAQEQEVDEPTQMAVSAATAISELIRGADYQEEIGRIKDEMLALQKLDMLRHSDSSWKGEDLQVDYKAQHGLVSSMLKSFEDKLNNKIHEYLQNRYNRSYQTKNGKPQSLVRLKLPGEVSPSISENSLTPRRVVREHQVFRNLFNESLKHDALKKALVKMTTRGGANMVASRFVEAVTNEVKTVQKQVYGQSKVRVSSRLDPNVRENAVKSLQETLKVLKDYSPEQASKMLDDLLSQSFDPNQKELNTSFSEILKAVFPLREYRLDLHSAAGLHSSVTRETIRKASIKIKEAESELASLDKAFDSIRMKSISPWSVGRTEHEVNLSTTNADDVAVVPVDLSFVPTDFDGATASEVERGRALLAERFDEMEVSDPDRYDFYIKMQAMDRAITEYSEKNADAAYKLLKGDTEFFSRNSPAELIGTAIRSVNTELAITKARETAQRMMLEDRPMGLQHLSPDLLAAMATEENGLRTIITVNGSNRQDAKIKLIKSPQGSEARKELFGHLVQDGDTWIVLAPTTVRQDMQKRFGKKGKGSNTAFRKIVLDSLPVGNGGVTMSSQMGFSNKYINGAYERDAFVQELDADGKPTGGTQNLKGKSRKEVADRLISDFNKRYIKVLNNGYDGNEKKAINPNDPLVKEALSRHNHMMRGIIYAVGHPSLLVSTEVDSLNKPIPQTAEFVDKFVNGMTAYNENGSPSMHHAVNLLTLKEMAIEDTFARVFADVEGQLIIDRLTAGLVTDPNDTTLFMAKFVHHQDARIKAKYVYNYASVQMAAQMQAFLDKGFDGQSGRTNYQVQLNKLTETLAASRSKLETGVQGLGGASSLDQARARMWAWLEGMKHVRSGDLSANFSREILSIREGAKDLRSLADKQKDQSDNKSFLGGVMNTFFSHENVNLVRDLPMVEKLLHRTKGEIGPILDDFLENKPDPHIRGISNQERTDAWALKKIEEAQAALLKESEKRNEIEQHGKDLITMFKGLTDAADITRMLSFEEPTDRVEKARKEIRSIVPILYQHANMPGSERIAQDNKYQEDPIEMINLNEASIFGGVSRPNPNRTKTVLRPVNLNGLTGINALIDDTLYRLNVTPNYNVLRKVVGRRILDSSNKMDKIEGSYIADRWDDRDARDPARKRAEVALAAVANEVESTVVNDMSKGIVNTHFSETTRFLSSMFIAKALTSLQQIWVQTVPALVFTPIKKLLTGDVESAKMFMKYSAHYAFSAMGRTLRMIDNDSSFATKIDNLVHNADPMISFRGGDGRDINKVVERHTNRYGQGIVKTVMGRFFKELESLQEASLDFAIAAGERAVAKPMYVMELLAELKYMKIENPELVIPTLDDLVNKKVDVRSLPIGARDAARTKVNDMFGQADQGKKGWAFQNRTTRAGWSDVLRSMTRFSNQTASMSSNITALLPMLPQIFKGRGSDSRAISWKEYYKGLRDGETSSTFRMHKEAVENIVGSVGQNILFHFIKPRVLVPLVAYAIFGIGSDDDDDDEEMQKAIDLSNTLMAENEDGSMIANLLKMAVFGKGSNMFNDWQDPEASRRSAYAQLMSQTGDELAQLVPGVGALYGYSPVNDMGRIFMDGMAERLATVGSDLELSKSPWDKKGVSIYERKKNPVEYAAQITAPTMALYDLVDSASTSVRAMGLDGITPQDQAMLWATMIWSPREIRSMVKGKMDKAIRDNE